ncbi:MAG: tRNA adenosine(34) deaminase TadA [Candidatus Hydrogenedentes bacterium]|nr:tRNA adenosine(34) deaminase TadA [Candidatus Hydrogenedentota bacterium]
MLAPTHEYYMREALKEAQKAYKEGEVPVGCVIVYEQTIIGRGYNQREKLQDPTAHAEILAITSAALALKSWRLENTRMYVTLEPCPMCAGAIILARIPELYFGAYDPKAGCCGSILNIVKDNRFNHNPLVISGICEEECSLLLSNFFKEIRSKNKYESKY